MGAGGALYFSARASALAAHPRKEETAAESSGSPLKRGEDLRCCGQERKMCWEIKYEADVQNLQARKVDGGQRPIAMR